MQRLLLTESISKVFVCQFDTVDSRFAGTLKGYTIWTFFRGRFTGWNYQVHGTLLFKANSKTEAQQLEVWHAILGIESSVIY